MAIVIDRPASFTQLLGTAEADVFKMVQDGANDAIVGFEDGSDVVDLTAFVGLTFGDLTLNTDRQGRVFLTFNDPDTGAREKITFKQTAVGFDVSDLTAADFIFQAAPQATPIPTRIVNDGTGPTRDQMFGNNNENDAFVLIDDNGRIDTIFGFDDGSDLIDLTAFGGLSFADLAIRNGRNDQVVIRWDTGVDRPSGRDVFQKIIVSSYDGSLVASDLSEADFVFAEIQPTPTRTVNDTTTRDQMFGNNNENDVFVLVEDGGLTDTIFGFEDGNDLIDLTALGASFADLTIADGANNTVTIDIDLGGGATDGLIVSSYDGTLVAADLSATDFLLV